MTLLLNSASELEDFANNTYLLKVLEGKIRPTLDIDNLFGFAWGDWCCHELVFCKCDI